MPNTVGRTDGLTTKRRPAPDPSSAEVEGPWCGVVQRPLVGGGGLFLTPIISVKVEGGREAWNPSLVVTGGRGERASAPNLQIPGGGDEPKRWLGLTSPGRRKDKGRIFHLKSTLTYLKTDFLKHIIICLFP